MAFYRASGNNGIESLRLDLYAYSHGWARCIGSDSSGNVTGNGEYQLQDTFIDRVTCISGTMSMVYYESEEATSTTTVNITTGQTINVGNNKGITLKWSGSQHYHGYDGRDSSGTQEGSLVVDIFFK